ncbi:MULTISPECIES: Uma2 family endonuclease [unclassified Microcoleus]|jgi:Uma2 family endonuclease|uniref:Uma2 family endonuclease n=1 Tax=unclassified Microcoleus TaxID=2642155 RepID=UPI001DDC3CA3|nr:MULTISPECIES: Uma2 family endonuclease [unclassified Microcoleus]MCC3464587.1 Uma2 family endonuclease [Microcoleus sp. PH2017_06_SFM_O_A]TAE43759.1 MAG: Uma2 family endonuclease [Oscillatoriales cyanobacterium]MCC3413437.1 Uma2 family endonuclease [Microcoleus sp. PH2017_02_FOX_O_A]MCC3491295.1 Uma2 family endonuclease [Microcoleus sp. PH2017_16_JOR_D_A]MCC3534325.1 Uma2 family endonuclease [Microcoleus sp. PH2017_25_DOB_D_A]
MISVAPIAPPLLRGEQRVVFRDITWEGYQQLLQILGDKRAATLTFDRGTLEITMPLEEHEFSARLIEFLIRILVRELGLKIKTMGSTTLDRSDLERGAEPDNAYYIQNQPLVAGRTVDLATDPPPDLVVEIDITHTDINKPALYASMGVPELWRYDGREWRIYKLENDEYLEVSVSPTFPILPKSKLYEFLAAAQVDEVEAEVNLRNWVRESTDG